MNYVERFTRRSLCIGATTALAAVTVRASPKPVIKLSSYLGIRGPQTSALRAAIADAVKDSATLEIGPGTIHIDDDIVVESDGLNISGAGEVSKIVQTTPGRGFLQLRGHFNRIRGLHFYCDYQRSRVPGRFRGYSGFQRVAAIWLEGGGTTIESISSENSFNTVCLRGPVSEPFVGADGRPTYRYVDSVSGNRLRNIAGRNNDFVLTGNQQVDLEVDDLESKGTTNFSVPPHAIYMQNPGSTSAFCGFSRNVRLKNLRASDNPYGLAFKLSDIRGLIVENAQAEQCAGGIMISTTDGAVLKKGMFRNLHGRNQSFNALSVSQSNRVNIADCYIDARTGTKFSGLTVYNGSKGVEIDRVKVIDDLPPSSAGTPFRVSDTSEALFSQCFRERRGSDRPMFIVAGQAQARIVNPECIGSSRLLHTKPGASVELAFDPIKIDNYNPLTSIQGEGTVKVGSITKPVSPPLLPGANGDLTCPS